MYQIAKSVVKLEVGDEPDTITVPLALPEWKAIQRLRSIGQCSIVLVEVNGAGDIVALTILQGAKRESLT